MEVAEAARAQGLCGASLAWPARSLAFGLIGNSMALPVVQRIAIRLLAAANIVALEDPWGERAGAGGVAGRGAGRCLCRAAAGAAGHWR